MIFRTQNKTLPTDKLSIKIDDTNIEQVNYTKFLGVIINNRLTWNDHVKAIYNKVSKSIGIIYRIRHNIPSNTLINLYHTLIHPYYEYCNIVWGSDNSTALQRLGRSQKRAVRAIVFANYYSHTAPIFKRLNIITITEINKLQTACFVYKSLNKLLPPQLADFFTPNCSVHNLNTRQHSKLHSVQYRIKIRANSIRIFGIKLWNSLSNKLRTSSTLSIFKKSYKKLLIHPDVIDV